MPISLALRKLLIVLLLALLLLIALYGMFMRTTAQPAHRTHDNPIAIQCPGPPFSCW